MKSKAFLSIKSSIVLGLFLSVLITLFIAKLYIQNETEEKLYASFAKQRKEITTNIATAMITPLKTFSPSDASKALKIIKQDSKIAHIEVHDTLLDTTFIHIHIPSRCKENLFINQQEIYSKNNKKLGWVEVRFNGVDIEKQLHEINKIIAVILICAFFVLVLIVTSLLQLKIFSPLKKLLKQAEDFQENRLKRQYSWKGDDELSIVGKSFDTARTSILSLIEQLSSKNQELEKLYITDKLTDIYNRHKLDTELKHQEDIYQRYKQTFGVILLDIDDFKSVNDTYGHLIGDKVLVEIAELLQNNLRKTDIFGRWGGEEFLIIIPQSNKEHLLELATKLKNAIASHDFTPAGHITASFGVSLYKKDLEMLLKNADDALYKVKSSGKNNIHCKTE